MVDNVNSANNKYNVRFGAATGNFGMNIQPSGVNNPQMQAQLDAQTLNEAATKLNESATKLNESATDSYLGQRLTSYSDIDPMLQYGVAIPTWLALNLTMDKVNKLYRGDYSKSLVGRIGNFGDKISSLLFDNPIGRILNKAANGGKQVFKNVVYDNSALLRAFDKTPSVQELKMAVSQAEGLKYMLPHDAVGSIWEKFIEPVKSARDLDTLGATKAEIEALEKKIGGYVSPEYKTKALQAEEYKLLNKEASPQEINMFKSLSAEERLAKIKELKIKFLGFKDVAEYETIKAAPEKYINRILEISKNKAANVFTKVDYSDKNLYTKAKSVLTGRVVHDSEIYNKIYGTLGGNHKSLLGQTMAKWTNKLGEGATNRLSGGKFAAAIHAFFLAEILIRANRQEGLDNKFKSFMERYAELIGFFVFAGPSLKLMNKIGGLQYSGMTPKQVEEYRKAVIEFNEHVMNCDWTKNIYKQKRNELRAKFRPKTRNPFVWAARKIGDVVTVGLEQVRPYTKHKVQKVDLTITNIMKNPKQYLKNIPHRLADFARNPKYWLKQMAGYPVRFAIPMMIFIPFFNKYIVKATNAIFGKPKEGALADEGKEEKAKEAAEALAKSQQIQQAQLLQFQNNFIKQQTNNAAIENPAQLKAVNSTNNASKVSHTGLMSGESSKNKQQNAVEVKEVDIPDNRYIPSSKPVVLKKDKKNDDKVNEALRKAELAEKSAYNFLTKGV